MTMTKKLAIASSIALTTLTGAAFSGDRETVEVFYDLLSNPGSETHMQAFMEVASSDWQSIGDYSGKAKNRDAFAGQIGGFAKLVPDLNWNIEAMYQDGDTFVVRSRATGTPVAPFFGVDGQGRSFDIMTIDIHTLEDGKIVQSHHVEDWAGALQQLSGK